MLFLIFIRNTSFKAAIRIDRLGACHEDVMLADKSDVFSRTHDKATMNRKTCAKDEKVALADYNTGACTDLEDFMADDTECVMKAGKIEHTYPSSIDLSIFLFKNFSAHQKRTFLRTYARIYSAIAPRLSVLDRVVRRTSNDKKEQLAHYMAVHFLRYGNVKRRMRYAFRCVYGCNEVVSMVLSVIGFVVNLWCGWGVLREKNREETKSDTGANTGRNAATGREHTSMIIDKDVQINTNGTGTVVKEYAVPVIVSEHVMKSKQRGMDINLVVEGEERTEMMLLMAKTKVKDENENASGAKEHAHSNHANNRVMTGNTETAHETEQAPFIRSYLTLIKVQCTINALTFMSSILLHINDTPLTKRLDYFFVLLSILHACHTFVVKLSYLYGTPRPSIFVSLTLFSLITAKHLFSFNPTLLKYTCALFISFFCAGMLFEYFKVRTPFIAVFVCLTILCVVVEGLDVRPIVFLVDSHAVWHFLVIGQMVLYYRYLKIDLKKILVRAGRANES